MKPVKRFFQALSLQLLGLAFLFLFVTKNAPYPLGSFWGWLIDTVTPLLPVAGFIWMCATPLPKEPHVSKETDA